MSIFDTLFGRKPEQKSYLPSPVWNAMVWAPGSLQSGKWDRRRIIEQAYERNATYHTAVNMIVNAVASMPLYVEVEVGGKIQRVENHPILRVLERNEPYRQFMTRFATYYVALGTTYANIVKDKDGKKPLGLITLPAQFVQNIQGTWMQPISGYMYTEVGQNRLPYEDVIHAYRPSMGNYWEEISPAVPLAEIIALNNAAITWNKNLAQSGGVPSMIAKVENLNEASAEKLKAQWAEQTGAKNSHQLKVVGDRVTLEKFSSTPNDSEWGNAVLQTMRMILMALGVSSSLANDAANKTYNNVHDARKGLYEEAAIPILELLLGAITSKLQPFYKDNPILRIDKAKVEPIQEDRRMAIQRLEIAVRSGIMTQNEARVELGLKPSKTPTADLLQNASIVNNIPKTPDEAPKPDEEEKEPLNTDEDE
jgi:HK97 family phage portal protein